MEDVSVKIGVAKADGEMYYRRVNLSNHPPSGGGWFLDRAKHSDSLVEVLKLHALQTHTDADALPDASVLCQYKVTLFHVDSDGDKILISNGRDLFEVLSQVRSDALLRTLARTSSDGSASSSGGASTPPTTPYVRPHFVAKVIAKVEALLPAPTEDAAAAAAAAAAESSPSNKSTEAPAAVTFPSPPPTLPTPPKPVDKAARRCISSTASTQTGNTAVVLEAPAAADVPEPSAHSTPTPPPPPPTIQDVVDAVVGIVGPAVRISVRAVEHAVNHHHHNKGATAATSATNGAAEADVSVPTEGAEASTAAAANPTVDAAAAAAEPPRIFIHGRHTCDGCLTTPIVGNRYHCLDMPDFDFCQLCYDKYDGPNKFEKVELERDALFQERWHRRRSRMHPGRSCGRRGHRGGGGFPHPHPHPHFHPWGPHPPPPPHHHHHPHPWGPPPPPPPHHHHPQPQPHPHHPMTAPVDEVDSALKEAIRRSLQDLKDKKQAEQESAAKVEVAKQDGAEAAANEVDAAANEVDAAAETLKAAPPAAAPTTKVEAPASTTRYAVTVDSDDDEDDDVKPAAEKAVSPAATESTKSVVNPATPVKFSPPTVEDDEPAAAPSPADINVSVAASEFSEDALGNGDVAAALGTMMDAVANCIQEMNGQFVDLKDDDDNEDDAKLGAKIVDGEENAPSDDSSVNSDSSSHGSWVVDDEFAATPEAMARAAMVIGSSLLSSDMAQSTGNPNPGTASSTLTSSAGSGSTSGASTETYSSVGSVPTTVPSIAAAPTVGRVTEDQLERWSVQLRHLHELGFHEDAILVDIIERLHAANIGVDSNEEVTVQQVVYELIKSWK